MSEEERYATHLPVLRRVGRLVNPRRVLEFGCGQWSTATFLDRDVYPDLHHLKSYEQEQGWADFVQTFVAEDDLRLVMKIVPHREMLEAIRDMSLSEYGLIFVDNGSSLAERVEVIEALAARKPKALVVIHDYEQPAYRKAASGFDHEAVYSKLTPHTGIVWNDREFELEAVDDAILGREVLARETV